MALDKLQILDRSVILLATLVAGVALCSASGCMVERHSPSPAPSNPDPSEEPGTAEPSDPDDTADPGTPDELMPSCTAWAEKVDELCGDEVEEVLRFNCAGEVVPKDAELACGTSAEEHAPPSSASCPIEDPYLEWNGAERHWYDVWWSAIYSTLADDEGIAEQAWEDCAALDDMLR